MLSKLLGLLSPDRGPKLPIQGAMLTDTGAVRHNNEDSVVYVLPAEPGGLGIALVADGMGGHAAGEVASAIAAATVSRLVFEVEGAPPQRLTLAFAAANDAIRAHVAEHPETSGMGTTCTAIVFDGATAFLAHIGDSRAYLVQGGAIRQISQDHSLVAELVRRGEMTEAQAEASPEKNVIMQALGLSASIAPQIPASGFRLEASDVLVLCSDGLSDLVSMADILALIRDAVPEAACRALRDAALSAGGHDNISVGVFRAGAPAEVAPAVDTRQTRVTALETPA